MEWREACTVSSWKDSDQPTVTLDHEERQENKSSKSSGDVEKRFWCGAMEDARNRVYDVANYGRLKFLTSLIQAHFPISVREAKIGKIFGCRFLCQLMLQDRHWVLNGNDKCVYRIEMNCETAVGRAWVLTGKEKNLFREAFAPAEQPCRADAKASRNRRLGALWSHLLSAFPKREATSRMVPATQSQNLTLIK